jgi:hypothetical protein
MTALYCGLTASNDAEMFRSMDAALNNGAEGIAIFTVNSLRSPEVRTQFKAYADSLRALRATSGLNPAAINREVNINPFDNAAIMALINERMSTAINAATLNLSEYRLVNEYGTTKCYQVTDQNSQVTFNVTFYFYGGIISGWDVEPEKASYENYQKTAKSASQIK